MIATYEACVSAGDQHGALCLQAEPNPLIGYPECFEIVSSISILSGEEPVAILIPALQSY